MTQQPDFIVIDDLSFHYDTLLVLTQVNLTLTKHKCYAVIGPNGGGKTTFLHLLMGLLLPTQGSVLIDGHPPEHFRENIGHVPQTPDFDKYFPLSVEELILMGGLRELTWYGKWKNSAKQRLNEVLTLVGLEEKKTSPIGKLSGGQVQRAYIARALFNRPQLLLLDEPTANLDPSAEQQIFSLLARLKRETSIFVVTHDLTSIASFADEVICIQKQVCLIDKENLCHHFAMGVYHPFPPGESS